MRWSVQLCIIFIVLGLVIIAAGLVNAGTPPEGPEIAARCKPLEDMLTDFAAISVDVYWLPPEAVAPLTVLHNRIPPESHERFDAGVYAEFPDHTGAVFWLRHGMVCDRSLFPVGWPSLRKLIEGTII
jgi:hypothetical protein